MSEMVPKTTTIPAMSDEAIAKAREFEEILKQAPQLTFETEHVIHAGMYARTMMLPAGHALVGALLKVPTILVVHGDCIGYIGGEIVHLSGHCVFAASAKRKQVFVAKTDTWLTMLLTTNLTDVYDIEEYFTDEADALASRKDCNANSIIITEVPL